MRDRYGVLFLGDIIGRPGRRALKKFLPDLLEKYSPALVVANGENAAGGIGITPDICRQLLAQVDVLPQEIISGTRGMPSNIWIKSRGC